MAKKITASEEVAEKTKFSKEQILSAKKYIDKKDVLSVILKESQLYTFDAVDELVEKFMKEKVK